MNSLNKIIEIFISLQTIIISAFLPVLISIPYTNKSFGTYDMPATWQLPIIIIITLIFNGEIVTKAFTIYLIMGLFFIPVFHQGGSIGYLLTPNFGYLLGIYPLIKIIDRLKKIHNHKIHFYDFLRYGILGICIMHITGIIYNSIQILYFKQLDSLLYNISKYSLGKFGYHLLMLIPITLLIKLINKIFRYKK